LVNVSSNYKGWLYLVASNTIENIKDFILDSNGVVYLPSYCKGIILDLKVDGKIIAPTLVHIDDNYYSSNANNTLLKISYKKLYFPLTRSDMSARFDTGIYFKDKLMDNFEYLLETNKIDKSKSYFM
jgi:hypothetical protein